METFIDDNFSQIINIFCFFLFFCGGYVALYFWMFLGHLNKCLCVLYNENSKYRDLLNSYKDITSSCKLAGYFPYSPMLNTLNKTKDLAEIQLKKF